MCSVFCYRRNTTHCIVVVRKHSLSRNIGWYFTHLYFCCLKSRTILVDFFPESGLHTSFSVSCNFSISFLNDQVLFACVSCPPVFTFGCTIVISNLLDKFLATSSGVPSRIVLHMTLPQVCTFYKVVLEQGLATEYLKTYLLHYMLFLTRYLDFQMKEIPGVLRI